MNDIKTLGYSEIIDNMIKDSGLSREEFFKTFVSLLGNNVTTPKLNKNKARCCYTDLPEVTCR